MSVHLPFAIPPETREGYSSFIAACRAGETSFRLTPRAEPSPFALCFAIFGYRLLGRFDILEEHASAWGAALRDNLASARWARRVADAALDKPSMQLLTFTLSALWALGELDRDPLGEIVAPLASRNVDEVLSRCGALRGLPQSGNQAMFLAVLLLHAEARLGLDTAGAMDRWIERHESSLNERGFWGEFPGMTHLQFQNGYHQYEIFNCLGRLPSLFEVASRHTAALADPEGHFAPYPGGGGCYDYDAVFLLTLPGLPPDPSRKALLRRAAAIIVKEQNPDGGFAESLRVRPRNTANLLEFARHVLVASGPARSERLRYALALQLPKHDRITTHWSAYSREWGESNLWDAWFRMLTLARIEGALAPQTSGRWGFLGFPGVGFGHDRAEPEVGR